MLKECKICLGEHSDEIHAATLSVRNWFHFQVTRWLDQDPAAPVFEVPEEVLVTTAAA